jgi:muramoyltetrapeptide carboxypeptidase LdcA involved in peptidoglycan recycling
MEKPKHLSQGDHVAVISLSRGLLGEACVSAQQKLGMERLRNMGLIPSFTTNACKGLSYLDHHPEARADDLKEAFQDNSIKAVICAIGGNDTYRTLPFLMDDKVFQENVRNHPKIFIGFSDTTVNHLMFFRLGMESFYGPNYLTDLSELSKKMLPYTEASFLSLFQKRPGPIESSPVWYEERPDYSERALGTERKEHKETKGYELIAGTLPVTGKLYGGCLESLAGLSRHDDFHLILKDAEWDGKIAFFETSEEMPSPSVVEEELKEIGKSGVFTHARGVIVGKPMDEKWYEEYKAIWKRHAKEIPVLFNVNFGHACPRTILAYGTQVTVTKNAITYDEDILL